MVVYDLLWMEFSIVSLIPIWHLAYFKVILNSVFEYTYLLWWNVFWSLCPVIAIGLFDRIVGMSNQCNILPFVGPNTYLDDDILMQLPELYRYGREKYWFGTWTFAVYMLDAVYQVCTQSTVYKLSN